MQLPIFFEENLTGKAESFELSAQTSKHISQVLRMAEGSHLILTNGKGVELTASIRNPDKKRTIVSIVSHRNLPAPSNLNAIAISIIKNENRFDWFIEKATELGIRRIYPLIADRTQKKSMRPERARNIMISAMIQSRQYFLPELREPVNLQQILAEKDFDIKLIAHCDDDKQRTSMSSLLRKNKSTLILIGPEGDFTTREIEACLKENFRPVSLGENRLRTETAGIAAAVLLTNTSAYQSYVYFASPSSSGTVSTSRNPLP